MTGYTREKGRGLAELSSKIKANDVGKSFAIPSPITGKPLEYTVKQLSIAEAKKLGEYRFNFRSGRDLNNFNVSDIADGIKATGTNSYPVYISEDENGSEVLVGLRRTFTVINHGKFLTALVFKNLSDEEKRHLAKTSDIYKAPSFCDKALKVISYKEEMEKSDVIKSDSELCELFEVSKGSMSEMLSIRKYEREFFDLFPSVSVIRQKFIRLLNSKGAFVQIDDVAICELKSLLGENGLYPINSTDFDESTVGEIERLILNYLEPKSKPSQTNDVALFKPGNYGKAIKVKSTKTDQVVSFSMKKIDESDLAAIKSILAKYNDGSE